MSVDAASVLLCVAGNPGGRGSNGKRANCRQPDVVTKLHRSVSAAADPESVTSSLGREGLGAKLTTPLQCTDNSDAHLAVLQPTKLFMVIDFRVRTSAAADDNYGLIQTTIYAQEAESTESCNHDNSMFQVLVPHQETEPRLVKLESTCKSRSDGSPLSSTWRIDTSVTDDHMVFESPVSVIESSGDIKLTIDSKTVLHASFAVHDGMTSWTMLDSGMSQEVMVAQGPLHSCRVRNENTVIYNTGFMTVFNSIKQSIAKLSTGSDTIRCFANTIYKNVIRLLALEPPAEIYRELLALRSELMRHLIQQNGIWRRYSESWSAKLCS